MHFYLKKEMHIKSLINVCFTTLSLGLHVKGVPLLLNSLNLPKYKEDILHLN